jgi:pyruvate-formate lyase-activating enzyme/SAM-dependent methyltransferase
MKALVKVGYGCNNHCTFCHTYDVRDVDAATEEIDRKIDRAARLGHTMIVLSGGEPTMRRELLRWASRSAARGLDFGLVTNGRMLAYAELVEKLMRLRLRYVYLSLHGGTAKVHNALVRADAFEQTFAAVGNLAGRGLDFTVNTVITRQNVEHLRGVVDALLPWPDVVVKFSMAQPKGGADRLFEHIIPRVSDVAARVKDAIEYGLEKSGGRQRYAHDGIPFCLLPGHEDRYDDLKTHRFATMIEVGEPDFFPVDDLAKVQPEDECGRCAVRGPCPGLYAGYREVHGDGEVHAVMDRPRSNSFTYVHEGTHGTLGGSGEGPRPNKPGAEGPRPTNLGRCPVRTDGVTPWDRGRILFLREGDRVERYRTQSRDFTDVEIARTKLELGQVYDDASTKDAPDDFPRDLVPLRRSPVCDPCDAREACGGLWERVVEDVFTRDDERVRALVGELEGEVLDVGCGEGRYEDVLGPRASSGKVRWVGLEPDAARAAAMRARAPWAEVRVAEAEGLDDVARFDHALVLRSWNHLHDPERAAAAIVRALRPGGTLLVADNVAFGLLRRSAPRERREAGGALLFEHYRNDDAARAHAVLSRLPLELLERRDVGRSPQGPAAIADVGRSPQGPAAIADVGRSPQGPAANADVGRSPQGPAAIADVALSNQWLLRYRRAP